VRTCRAERRGGRSAMVFAGHPSQCPYRPQQPQPHCLLPGRPDAERRVPMHHPGRVPLRGCALPGLSPRSVLGWTLRPASTPCRLLAPRRIADQSEHTMGGQLIVKSCERSAASQTSTAVTRTSSVMRSVCCSTSASSSDALFGQAERKTLQIVLCIIDFTPSSHASCLVSAIACACACVVHEPARCYFVRRLCKVPGIPHMLE